VGISKVEGRGLTCPYCKHFSISQKVLIKVNVLIGRWLIDTILWQSKLKKESSELAYHAKIPNKKELRALLEWVR
jgi:hypothetical protein